MHTPTHTHTYAHSYAYTLTHAQVQGTGKDGRILKEDVLNHVENQSSSSSDSSDEEEGMVAPSSLSAGAGKVLATPTVRRVAREWGVSLSDVRGSGEGGRVLKEDILRHVETVKGENLLRHEKTMILLCDNVHNRSTLGIIHRGFNTYGHAFYYPIFSSRSCGPTYSDAHTLTSSTHHPITSCTSVSTH